VVSCADVKLRPEGQNRKGVVLRHETGLHFDTWCSSAEFAAEDFELADGNI